jgi:hypothetical protein
MSSLGNWRKIMWQVSAAPSGPPGVPARPATYRDRAQNLDFVPRHKIEIQRLGWTVAAQSANEELQHVDLALPSARLDGEDEARGVVEQRVDADGDESSFELQRPRVADICVPERSGPIRLPAQADLVANAVSQGHPIEPVLGEEATDRRR